MLLRHHGIEQYFDIKAAATRDGTRSAKKEVSTHTLTFINVYSTYIYRHMHIDTVTRAHSLQRIQRTIVTCCFVITASSSTLIIKEGCKHTHTHSCKNAFFTNMHKCNYIDAAHVRKRSQWITVTYCLVNTASSSFLTSGAQPLEMARALPRRAHMHIYA